MLSLIRQKTLEFMTLDFVNIASEYMTGNKLLKTGNKLLKKNYLKFLKTSSRIIFFTIDVLIFATLSAIFFAALFIPNPYFNLNMIADKFNIGFLKNIYLKSSIATFLALSTLGVIFFDVAEIIKFNFLSGKLINYFFRKVRERIKEKVEEVEEESEVEEKKIEEESEVKVSDLNLEEAYLSWNEEIVPSDNLRKKISLLISLQNNPFDGFGCKIMIPVKNQKREMNYRLKRKFIKGNKKDYELFYIEIDKDQYFKVEFDTNGTEKTRKIKVKLEEVNLQQYDNEIKEKIKKEEEEKKKIIKEKKLCSGKILNCEEAHFFCKYDKKCELKKGQFIEIPYKHNFGINDFCSDSDYSGRKTSFKVMNPPEKFKLQVIKNKNDIIFFIKIEEQYFMVNIKEEEHNEEEHNGFCDKEVKVILKKIESQQILNNIEETKEIEKSKNKEEIEEKETIIIEEKKELDFENAYLKSSSEEKNILQEGSIISVPFKCSYINSIRDSMEEDKMPELLKKEGNFEKKNLPQEFKVKKKIIEKSNKETYDLLYKETYDLFYIEYENKKYFKVEIDTRKERKEIGIAVKFKKFKFGYVEPLSQGDIKLKKEMKINIEFRDDKKYAELKSDKELPDLDKDILTANDKEFTLQENMFVEDDVEFFIKDENERYYKVEKIKGRNSSKRIEVISYEI